MLPIIKRRRNPSAPAYPNPFWALMQQKRRRRRLTSALAAPFSLSQLISHWKLNESTETRFDSHGTNNLEDNNGVALGTGLFGDAALFTAASSQWLSVESNPSLQTGDVNFTLCAWVKASDLTENRTILSKFNADDSNREYDLYYDADLETFAFRVSSNGEDEFPVFAQSLGQPNENTWYFICAWHDATNDKLNIQVNNLVPNSIDYALGVFASEAALNVGRNATSAGSAHWEGLIESVSFFKRVLTPEERAFLYNNGTGLAYPFPN